MSSRLFACMSSMRPTRSRLSRVELRSESPRRHLAGIDAAEGDRADEGIVHDLEGEHGERLVVRRTADDLFLGLEVDALDRLAIGRRRQVVDDRVEQRLHALVLERRAAEHRMEGAHLHREAHETAQRRLVRLMAVEIGGHRIVVELDRGLDQLLAVLDRLVLAGAPGSRSRRTWRRAPRPTRRSPSS